MRNCWHEMTLRLNEKEYNRLQRLKEKSGLSASAIIRKLLLKAEIRARPTEKLAEIVWQLSKIGNNINQLAYQANSGNFVPAYEVEAMRRELHKIWEEVRGL